MTSGIAAKTATACASSTTFAIHFVIPGRIGNRNLVRAGGLRGGTPPRRGFNRQPGVRLIFGRIGNSTPLLSSRRLWLAPLLRN
jgi:hypothetical protein